MKIFSTAPSGSLFCSLLHPTLSSPSHFLESDSKKIEIPLTWQRISLWHGHQPSDASPDAAPGQVVLGPAFFAATAESLLWSFFTIFVSSDSSKTCCVGICELRTESLFGEIWKGLEVNPTTSTAKTRG